MYLCICICAKLNTPFYSTQPESTTSVNIDAQESDGSTKLEEIKLSPAKLEQGKEGDKISSFKK